MMQIERSQVTKMVITGAYRLDPITVYAEDIEPRRGRITVQCYGKAWSGYWGGMGERTIAEFFRSCSVDYLANCMTDIQPSLTDETAIEDGARRQIIKLRRGEILRSHVPGGRTIRYARNEITAEEARDLWTEVDGANFGNDGWNESKLLERIFGEEWWYSMPTRPNPDWQYLCRIIGAVQEAFALDKAPAASTENGQRGSGE
jgi:hypothetical protein